MHGNGAFAIDNGNQSPQNTIAQPFDQLRVMGKKNKILGPRPAINRTKELTLNVQRVSPRREPNQRNISPFEEGFLGKSGQNCGCDSPPSIRRRDTNKLTIVLDKHGSGSRESLKDE